jgi:pimeloyl-ACP methyl ester carboxylesterase
MPWLALAPRGDNHHVMVLPGFGADDRSTRLLRNYLGQQGYQDRRWDQGRNMGLRRLGGYDPLVERVKSIAQESGGTVSLIGWSLGGVHARAIAKILPDEVRQVITLGSPIGGPLEQTAMGQAYARANGDPVAQRFVERLIEANRMPPPVPSTAIFSKYDGVVPWQIAREPTVNTSSPNKPGRQARDAAPTENIEVFASHIGLGFNPSVYFAVADRLSQAEGSWEPFSPKPWLAAAYRVGRPR